jgi:membrane-associated phospholipid phosphatase
LVGFSVIYTGFHFLKDVAAGIFFSALIVFFENKVYEKFSL